MLERFYEAKVWYNEKIVETTLKNLTKNGFNVLYVPKKEDALKKILEMVPIDAKVGVGGSLTIREMGLIEALKNRGNIVLDTWQPNLPKKDELEMRRNHLTSDVFISSTNALTIDGKLVNIDGVGNRVAAMIFGPKKVIVVAGINKIVKDVNEGIKRIRDLAAPLNAKRSNRKTPCALTGFCDEENCEPPDRICKVITIIERKPTETDTTLILVGEPLGY
ncbi:MAG: lactate utilization protein [Nitrososphaerota archaeon]|nr:lactate utilization protein [Nitrososphaerales archaeon]MDW8044411.1 lactate utilization protein [Nitrososphaerota archaeon]